MLRTAQSLPQEWAFDTGLRPRPFPDEAASLLPGPLAATRTGLTPASDNELTTQDQPPTRSTSCLLGARKELTSHTSPDVAAQTWKVCWRSALHRAELSVSRGLSASADGPTGDPLMSP